MKWMPGRSAAPAGDEGPDLEVAAALGALDPGTADPGYWLRFQRSVLERARPELARRRLLKELTMGDVLDAWARALVPTALLAAAAAALILFRQAPSPAPATVEELLTFGIETRTIPEVLSEGESAASVDFASERF